MSEVHLESVSKFRRSALAMLLLAVGLIAWGIAAGNRHIPVAGIWPLLLGFAWALSVYPEFHGELREEGLELTEPAASIPWTSVIGIWSKHKCRAGDRSRTKASSLVVLHDAGQVEIPPWLNHPSSDVYAWVIERIAGVHRSRPPERLKILYEQAVTEFGADSVCGYTRRSPLRFKFSSRAAQYGCIATAMTGLVWLVNGIFDRDGSAWIGWGIAALFLGGICRTMVRGHSKPTLPREVLKGPGELVLSPRGLALVQSDLSGTMRWDEIRDVKYHDGHLNQRIELKIAGGEIFIDDIYDCSLPIIFERIESLYRRGLS